MSAGFGGRLLGAILAPSITSYIGVDPSEKSYEGLHNLSKALEVYHTKKIVLHKVGSEDYVPAKESLDICFTSPPYFDTEKYSSEATQSYIKFPKADTWLEVFIRLTIKNCEYGLKSGGYFIMNLANVKSFQDLEARFLKLMKSFDFEYVETLKYSLSAICKSGFKYEPIFVFRKK